MCSDITTFDRVLKKFIVSVAASKSSQTLETARAGLGCNIISDNEIPILDKTNHHSPCRQSPTIIPGERSTDQKRLSSCSTAEYIESQDGE